MTRSAAAAVEAAQFAVAVNSVAEKGGDPVAKVLVCLGVAVAEKCSRSISSFRGETFSKLRLWVELRCQTFWLPPFQESLLQEVLTLAFESL
jgi:N-acetylglucosamine kinase-like BadF-type ATPase